MEKNRMTGKPKSHDITINITDSGKYIQSINDMLCGKTAFAELSAEYFSMDAFDIPLLDDIKLPSVFPECCNYHKGIFQEMVEWFEKFPNCCSNHKKLLKANWFNKEKYAYVPLKVVTQIALTHSLISDRIANADWYEDITDYIDYNYSSFGSLPLNFGPPVGLEVYLASVKTFLEDRDQDKFQPSVGKRKRLIEFVNAYYHTSRKTPDVNLNKLHDTYKNWLRLFPFGISYFAELKTHFNKYLPILTGKPQRNRYSKLVKLKIQTQSGFIQTLTEITKNLLRQIDSVELLKRGIIKDSDKYRFELITESHKIKQVKLLDDFTNSEIKYIDILRKWLAAEEELFVKLKPLLINKIGVFKTEVISKPKLKEDVVQTILDILGPHFSNEDFTILSSILRSGEDSGRHLIFQGNGNRITDAFKKLFESKLLVGCNKKQLGAWISRNFKFTHKEKTHKFSADYLEKGISRKDFVCKSPLFKIVNGKIVL